MTLVVNLIESHKWLHKSGFVGRSSGDHIMRNVRGKTQLRTKLCGPNSESE